MINAYAAKEKGGKFEPYEYDPGALGDHEVEIEVHSCGVCHKDTVTSVIYASMETTTYALSKKVR